MHSQTHRPSFPLLLSLHCRLVAAKVRLLIVSPMPSGTASTAASPEDEGELNPWQRRVIARTAAQSKGAAGGPRRNTSGSDDAIANPVPAGLNTSDGGDGVANPVPEDRRAVSVSPPGALLPAQPKMWLRLPARNPVPGQVSINSSHLGGLHRRRRPARGSGQAPFPPERLVSHLQLPCQAR